MHILSVHFKGGYVRKFTLQHSDMIDEMKNEAMELCVTACEKFAANNEVKIICLNTYFFLCGRIKTFMQLCEVR